MTIKISYRIVSVLALNFSIISCDFQSKNIDSSTDSTNVDLILTNGKVLTVDSEFQFFGL